MPKIFRTFNLNEEVMELLNKEQRATSPEAGRKLLDGLRQKGYDVLESSSHYNGVPTSIILGGGLGMRHKTDFYILAEELGLHFTSGNYYS